MSTIDCDSNEGVEGFYFPEVAHEVEGPEHKDYSVVPTEKFFSKEFTVLHKGWPTWVITTNRYAKSFFQFWDWRTHYTVRDATSGKVIAEAVKDYGFSFQGIMNLSFLGWFRPHTLADFQIYDKSGNHIGMIDGKVLDLSAARFDFVNPSGGIHAYAKQEGVKIAIRDYTTNHVLVHMQRKFDQGYLDSWSFSTTTAFDPRISLIFAAFTIHHQSRFIKDN